jgi:uncharacterized protein (UPF0332 family)
VKESSFAQSGTLDPRHHRYLLEAQDLRNVGDYGIGSSVTTDQASKTLEWAREFIAAA